MMFKQFYLESLGHASYLIGSEETGEALVLDPRRDVDVYFPNARQEGVLIAFAVDTHQHNDYLSGARELSYRGGVEILASASAQLGYPARPLKEGERLEIGEIFLGVLQTPGHTPEHISLLVRDWSLGKEPVLLLSGGSLLVGDVARPDLLGGGGGDAGGGVQPLSYTSDKNSPPSRSPHGLSNPCFRLSLRWIDRGDALYDRRLRAAVEGARDVSALRFRLQRAGGRGDPRLPCARGAFGGGTFPARSTSASEAPFRPGPGRFCRGGEGLAHPGRPGGSLGDLLAAVANRLSSPARCPPAGRVAPCADQGGHSHFRRGIARPDRRGAP